MTPRPEMKSAALTLFCVRIETPQFGRLETICSAVPVSSRVRSHQNHRNPIEWT
ncbi:hypothetical protein RSAG8_02497, partial [Rhizoctonia solani AG-8 WAC10335]